MIAQIASGHVDLADVLFLIAFIIFVIAAVLSIIATTVKANIQNALPHIGLALVALAFFVL